MRKLVVTAIAVAASLAGCGPAATEAGGTGGLEPYLTQEVVWDYCDEALFDLSYQDSDFDERGVLCATVKVPATYADPGVGDDLELTLMKDIADGNSADYLGTLFTNPGGPGASGIDYIQQVDFPEELRYSYDIIGVDPRGVGASSPVRCSDELDLRSYYESAFDYQNLADFKRDQRAWREYYRDCVERNPHWWTISTANVVADFELLRGLLTGDEPFNFIGHSYGTTIGGRYISTYPEHVGRIVLDSPVKPDDSADISEELAQTKSMAKALARLMQKCAEDPACPGESVAEVEDYIIKYRDETLKGNMEGYVASQLPKSYFQSGNGESAYLIMRGLSAISYWPVSDAYPIFSELMLDLRDGWLGGFEWYGLSMDGYDLMEMTRDNSYEVMTIVNCLDVDGRDLRTEAELEADDAAFAAADPFGERFDQVYDYEPPADPRPGCEWSWLAYEDDTIPDPPAAQPAFTNTSGKPVLVIGSKGDNVTPYEWSVGIAQSLMAALVTYEGTGHAMLFGNSDCLNRTATRFLLTGRDPGAISCRSVD